MERLWTDTENRRYNFVNILYNTKDWVTLEKLAADLNCSTRVLSKDIIYFKEVFNNLNIDTSRNGVRLVDTPETGMLSITEEFLKQSKTFNLLEKIFLSEDKSVAEIATESFHSVATVYRLIDDVNKVIENYGFWIETNPCRIVGDEASIRLFFYRYFKEKYNYLAFPFESIDHEALKEILAFFIQLSGIETDFGYYNIFKYTTSINITRYKGGHYLEYDKLNSNFTDFYGDISEYSKDLKYFEHKLGVKFDNHFLEQVWGAYIDENFSVNHEILYKKTLHNEALSSLYDFINAELEEIKTEFYLDLDNRDALILNGMNALHLDDKDGTSGYILYDRNQAFVDQVKLMFPMFSATLTNAVENILMRVGTPITSDKLNYHFFVIFTLWSDLLNQLLKKAEGLKILIISERHVSHARMLRDYLKHELSSFVVIEIFEKHKLDITEQFSLGYDIYITDYPTIVSNPKHVFIENIPSIDDIQKTQRIVRGIIAERKEISMRENKTRLI